MSSSATTFTPSAPAIEGTYKMRDVEGVLDLIFYRRVGYWIARAFARAGMSPNQVSLLAAVVGIAAGHLYYYQLLWVNVIGMVLHVAADLFDNVDGQLARLTGKVSEDGRVLDGISDNLVFASVYAHICLRSVHAGGSSFVWLLALAAGLCHSYQSSAAEFCREVYVGFVKNRPSQLFSAHELGNRLRNAAWAKRPWHKILLALHANYLRQQELALPALAQLRDRALQVFGASVPEWFSARYRDVEQRVVRRSRFLGANTRMAVIFLVLFLRHPTWYFIAELTLFNAIFAWLVVREQALAATLLPVVNERAGD